MRKGATEAGAIYVKIARLDGTADLFGPAPQAAVDPDHPASGGRLFETLMTASPEWEVDERLRSEVRFDPDVWIVECEARDGTADLDIIDA